MKTGRVVATTVLHRSDGASDIVDGVWVRTFTFGNNNRCTIWKNADEAEHGAGS